MYTDRTIKYICTQTEQENTYVYRKNKKIHMYIERGRKYKCIQKEEENTNVYRKKKKIHMYTG